MALSGSISDPYSGRTQYTLKLTVTRSAVSGTSAKWKWTLVASGSGTSYCLNAFGWTVNVAGQAFSGSHNLDMRDSPVTVATGETGYIAQTPGVAKSISMSFKHGGDACGIFGTAQKSGSFSADAIAGPPGAPGALVVSNLTPVSADFSWGAAATNGSAITNYGLYISTDPAFGSHVYAAYLGTVLSKSNPVALTPNTTYYARNRAVNGAGTGPYNTAVPFTTPPATPPTLVSATPDATGKQLTVVMSPPAGLSSVNSYTVESRTPGGAWSVRASGSPNPSQVITGLTPGATYEWRVKAVIGSYTTPESSTLTRTQPQPNTSPGGFFDGDTPDVPGLTNYTWTSTPGASTSQAQTLTGGAVGWLSGAQAVADSGGTAAQYQVAGGIEPNGNSGDWSVQYAMLQDATDNGFRAGTDGTTGYAIATVGGKYMGSLWVQSNRARDLAAMIVWFDNAGVEQGTSEGVAVAVAKDVPIRLNVLGTAPAGATRAAVVVTDPAGTSMMQAGDLLIVDAVMSSTGTLYPYFDGDTADTAQFLYAWEGAQYTTASFRESIPQAEQNPLQDPNCDPLPVPPSPPPIEDDCITPVGSWRRTWYIIDAASVPEYLSAVPTVLMTTFADAQSQVRLRWYSNPDCTPPLDFDSSSWEFEQIISYIPPYTRITLDGVSSRVWAEVDGGEPIPADSLLYGTGGVPATWPVISCGGCWLVSLDTDLDSAPGTPSVSANITVRE